MKKMNKQAYFVGAILLGFVCMAGFQNCGQFTAMGTGQRGLSSVSPEENAFGQPTPEGELPTTDPEQNPVEVNPVVGDAGGPGAPVNLRFTLRTSAWVELTWDPPPEGESTSYRIYRDGTLADTVEMNYQANGGEQGQRVRYERTRTFVDCNGGLDATAACRDLGGPTPGATHTYYVTAVNSQGLQSASSEAIRVPFEPKIATPPKSAPYEIVFEEQFNDVSAGALSQDWFFKRLWDQEARRDVYDQNANAQQIINGENGYLVDPTDPAQAGAYNPFQPMAEGLRIRSEMNNGRLTTTAFTVGYNADANQEEIQNISGSHYSHLSGLLRSKATFINGYIEARMRVAGDHKFLSTFYLLNASYFGQNPPLYGEGEIDIMEYLGGREPIYGTPERGRYVYQNYHYRSNLRNGALHKMPGNRFGTGSTPYFSDDFHTYGVLWENNVTIYFIDDIEVFRAIGPAVSTDPKYIILSLVAGGAWANHPDEANGVGPTGSTNLDIDYIRIYQNPDSPNTMFNPGQ